MSLVDLHENDTCLLVPARAKSHDGFRQWLIDEGVDSTARVSYLGGDLFIEMDSEDLNDPLEIVVPAKAKSHNGFRKWLVEEWGERPGRISYLKGDLFIDMSPEDLETHNQVKSEVSYVIVGVNKRLKKGKFYTDGTLVSNPDAGLSTEPDGTFVLWETLRTGRAKRKARKRGPGKYTELVGSPDWIMEIISPSSFKKDTQTLPPIYHKAKVAEYWLINALGEDIDFQIQVWRKSGYKRVPVKDGWQRSPLFGCWFRLTRREDQLGDWEYTLEVRE